MVNFLWIEVLSFPLLSFLHVWSVSCQRYVWNFVGRFETSNVRLICCLKEFNFASIFLLLWLLEKNWIFKQFVTTLAIWVQTSILLVWDINSCHLYFFFKILVIIVNNNMWPWASNLYMVVLQPMMIYLINWLSFNLNVRLHILIWTYWYLFVFILMLHISIQILVSYKRK